MNIKEVLFDLTDKIGVVGDELSACECAKKYLSEYTNDIEIDDFNNVIGRIGSFKEGRPHILLDAHIDEIGMVVTYITDEGFLRVANCGGIDGRILLGQEVTIYGKEPIKGIITSTPPHVETDTKKVPAVTEIYIDTGYSKEKAQEIVSLGDRVVITQHTAEMLNNRVTAKAIDDRSGVVAILHTLELVKGKDLPVNLTVLFSAQEETGGSGAKIAAYKINPDIAIAVDVSFAKTIDDTPENHGIMGEGAMIGVSPTLNRELSNKFIALAKENDMKYQIEIMPRLTGTNADDITVSRNGVKSITLSIPLKYMHTPIEVVDLNDIENVGELMAKYLLSFK